jgi:hypothetical protein
MRTPEEEIKLKELELIRNNYLKRKEELWRQRSRAIWLKSGDGNTKFFHSFANFRRNKNFVWEIKDDLGNLHSGQETLKSVATNYFKSFFKAEEQSQITDQVRVVNLFNKFITEEDAKTLFRPVESTELKAVLSFFKRDKSSGPDGWTVEFFSHFFDLVGGDLLEMVEETRTKGLTAGGLNSTFLALIPKVNKPQTFGDYRPISLCNLV